MATVQTFSSTLSVTIREGTVK